MHAVRNSCYSPEIRQRRGENTSATVPGPATQFLPAILGKLSSCHSQSQRRICPKSPTLDVMCRKLSCSSGRWAYCVVCRLETPCGSIPTKCHEWAETQKQSGICEVGLQRPFATLRGQRCVTEWCDKKSKPRSPALLTWSIRASPLPLVPGQCWGRTLDFVHRSLMRKGSQSLFCFTVCSLIGHWQAGAGSIGPGTGALRRMGSRPRASRGLSRQPTLFAISIQEPIGHSQERPLKPRDEVSKLVNAVGCYNAPRRLEVGWTISPRAARQALPGYRRQ